MKRKITAILFLLQAHCYFAQPVSDLNRRLDSVINAKITYRARFIYLTGNTINVDTLSIKKVQAGKKDSTILITFSNKTQKQVRASEFWGLITDYGERRRFYRGRVFPVWRSVPPYFYRITKGGADRYYFSETLTGDIYPLSLVSVNEHVLDPVTKNNLETYIKENLPKNTNDNEKGDDSAFFSQMLTGSVNLTVFLLNILAECIK